MQYFTKIVVVKFVHNLKSRFLTVYSAKTAEIVYNVLLEYLHCTDSHTRNVLQSVSVNLH